MKSNKHPSVAEATRSLLERKPFLKELMAMDAVNYRGLARHFRDQVEEMTGKEAVSLDSIVVAIRRYERDAFLDERLMERIEDVLHNSELTMRSDIVYYTLPRTERFHSMALEAYQEIDQRSAGRAYLLQSDAEIAFITNEKNAEPIKAKLDRDEAKNIERDLAMIVMESPDEVLEADGIISYLTEKIIMDGIGLIDLVTTYTEFVFLVREEDSTQLYEVLRGVITE